MEKGNNIVRTLQEKFHCDLLEEKKGIGVMKEKAITERLKECVYARMCDCAHV